ncbi:MAG: hypothetical protein Q7V01_08920 [Vicinamibacterales bacterium]|nr:hypothetical protein [Vicinamibacterales bacterium]
MSPFQTHRGVTILRQVEVDIFPARIEERGLKILAVLAMFFGLSFGGLPLVAIIMAAFQEGVSADLLGALLFTVPLVGLFGWMTVYGFDQWVQRTIVELDGGEVRWEWRTWRGTRRRTEPLAGFTGVRSERRFDSDDGDLWEVWLQHPEPVLTVLLYRANRETGFTERWQRYCQVFGLPALESLGLGGTVVRPTEDLDLSLTSLAREGRAAIPDPGPAPPGVEITSESGRTVLRLPHNPDLVFGLDHIELPRPRVRSAGATVTHDQVVSATVEREPMTFNGHVLVLRHRTALPNGMALNLKDTLARKLPVSTLVWVQRYVLRAIARR